MSCLNKIATDLSGRPNELTPPHVFPSGRRLNPTTTPQRLCITANSDGQCPLWVKKRTLRRVCVMSALPSKADIATGPRYQFRRNNSGSLAIIHSKGVSKPYNLSISPTATLSIPITMYFAKWAHAFAMYLEVTNSDDHARRCLYARHSHRFVRAKRSSHRPLPVSGWRSEWQSRTRCPVGRP